MKRKPLHALLFACLAAGFVTFSPAAWSADCFAIGERIARERGGSLAAAQSASQGGRQVCVIVVLVPGNDGKRPRRQEIVVPQ